jgi:hypothetical protein
VLACCLCQDPAHLEVNVDNLQSNQLESHAVGVEALASSQSDSGNATAGWRR